MWRTIFAASLVPMALAGCAQVGVDATSAPQRARAPMPAAPVASAGRDAYMKVHATSGTFEDVRDFVELAITGRGMVINNVSHIGNMLQRTGRDIGAARRVYAKAEALEFCSATLSRKMMEADPRNIVFCPYTIAVYTMASRPGRVFVAYRRPPTLDDPASRKALRDVERLLGEIVAEAIGK